MWSTQAKRNNFFCLSVWHTHRHTHTHIHTHAHTHTHTHTHTNICTCTHSMRIFLCNTAFSTQTYEDYRAVTTGITFHGCHICALAARFVLVLCVCVCVRASVCVRVCVCVCLKRRQQEGSRNVICCHAVDVWASAPLHLCTQHFPWSRLFCCIWQQRFSCCYRVKYAAHTNGCVLVR